MRVTDMRGVDLARYAFDFDLTFSAMTMHADGTVYHRFGGRDHTDPVVWSNLETLEHVLRTTLDEHEAYAADPDPPPAAAPLRLEEVPAYVKRDNGECIHCHMVLPALHEEAEKAGTWREGDLWLYPPPARVGLELDAVDQALVVSVAPDSPAAAVGVEAGDRLVSVGGQRVATITDVQLALQQVDPQGAAVALLTTRDGQERAATLALEDGWRRGTPLTWSWRPFKWHLAPMPGFGGPELTADAKRALGLDEDAFAFRVNYLVTWNENRRFGQEAQRAGLRKNDVVTSIGGKDDFHGVQHVHAWWRLTREVGGTVELVTYRNGQRRVLEMDVLE